MRRAALFGVLTLAGGCAAGAKSSMVLERHVRPLGTSGPDAVALPVNDRYRYGVVVGSVMTAEGERGCNGEVWLEPAGAPVRDVRTIAGARLQNMFRFPQLLPGRYELGVRCLGFEPVRKTVEVRIGQVLRAVVTMVRRGSRGEGRHPEPRASSRTAGVIPNVVRDRSAHESEHRASLSCAGRSLAPLGMTR